MMKRFRFNLAAVLSYRSHLEHQAQMDLGKAQADVDQCEKRIRNLRNDQAQKNLEMEEHAAKGISAQRFLLFSEFLSGVEAQILQERQRHHQLVEVMLDKQRVLAQKTIEKKMIENIRERREKEYYNDMLKEIYKETDDMILLRKARKVTHDT